MKQSKEFIKNNIIKNSNIVEEVKSNHNDDLTYLVHKKEGEWFCTCKSYRIRKTCSHIKFVTKEIGEGDKCFYCGKSAWSAGGLDKQHVLRRSTDPESKMDTSNIMILCRMC